MPWMVELAKARYPRTFDIESAELWFRGVVLKQPTVFYPIRTDHAFMVTLIAIIPWTPSEPEANSVMLCAEDGHMWDAIRLVRASIEWAGRRKCARWQLNSDTDYDLEPIARLMGANILTPRYSIRFQP